MGVRTYHDLTFQVGRDNSLVSGNLIADIALAGQLDTLARAISTVIDLDAAETGFVVDFGDIAEARFVYIEADGEISVTPGAPGAPTAAAATGAAGTFPTGFIGGETLSLDVDNFGTVVVTFTSGAQLAQDVVNEINAAFALAGFLSGGLPVTVALVFGGEIRIASPTLGAASEVEVVAGSAGVLATLGLSTGITNGVNAIAGQTPIQLYRPANISNPSLSDGVKSFMLATMRTTSLTIDNLDTASGVTVTVVIAGDVLTTPPTDC